MYLAKIQKEGKSKLFFKPVCLWRKEERNLILGDAKNISKKTHFFAKLFSWVLSKLQ